MFETATSDNTKFAKLFKKYRLLAQFSKIPELANAFAEKGFFFDLSLYYNWQKGKRIPRKRNILICLLIIFIERSAISSMAQANELLEASGHGYLTKTDLQNYPLFNNLTA